MFCICPSGRKDLQPQAKDLSLSFLQTKSQRLSQPYSNCTETGADIPVENLYNKTYSLQVGLSQGQPNFTTRSQLATLGHLGGREWKEDNKCSLEGASLVIWPG